MLNGYSNSYIGHQFIFDNGIQVKLIPNVWIMTKVVIK